MAGTTVLFPNGQAASVGAVGTTRSWSYSARDGDATIPNHFTMVNWGVPGIAVAEYDRAERLRTIWATSREASHLQRQSG